jgi:oligosaccharyltransferase complex subunit delta (ribophorin II)
LQSEDSTLVADNDVTFVVKVVRKVVVENCNIQIVDKDQSLVAKSVSMSFSETSSAQLEADYHQRVVMKFSLKDTLSGDFVKAHQTFVRLTHSDTNQEIFFVAEVDSGDEYKFDLDVGAAAADSFHSLGGKYQLDLIVGDAGIENPFSWKVCSISLTFAETALPSAPKEKFSVQPEIHHIFRKPEPRPPRIITVVFTALVVAPVLLLLILWLYLGANLSGLIQSGLPGILFSVGLGAILCLLFVFWLSLNMFTTLKLLAAVGAFTFVAGQRMLRNIAEKKA